MSTESRAAWLRIVATIDDRGGRFVSLYTHGVGGGRWLEVERDLLARELFPEVETVVTPVETVDYCPACLAVTPR